VVAQLLLSGPHSAALARLSTRERDVLALMAEGHGNTTIADKLFVAEGANHKHIRSIFAKPDLATDDRTDRRVAAVLRYLEDTHRG
jgi:DNA-binding NarL/FixJ family response regulator